MHMVGLLLEFAGDALTVIFPSNDRQTAINACQTTFDIQQVVAKQAKTKISLGQFALEVKLGLGAGLVEWGIIGPLAHRTYFFRGTAVSDCVKAEGFADEGEIILAPSLQTLLEATSIQLKKKNGRFTQLIKQPLPPATITSTLPQSLDPEICYKFFSPILWQHAQQGEFRQAAVVFFSFQADISNDKLEKMATSAIETCDQFSGYFIEVEFGDKGGVILVCFGAPKAHENDIERALGFSLALATQLDELDIEWRAGVTYGQVYAGLVGSTIRNKYSIIGNVVNLAARLMAKALKQQIFVSDQIVQEAKFSFNFVGNYIYKGYTDPLPTHQLIGYQLTDTSQLQTIEPTKFLVAPRSSTV